MTTFCNEDDTSSCKSSVLLYQTLLRAPVACTVDMTTFENCHVSIFVLL